MREKYLLGILLHVDGSGVYIHPRVDPNEMLSALCTIISDNENKDPDTFSIILGDFNSANLRDVLPTHRTRLNRGLVE